MAEETHDPIELLRQSISISQTPILLTAAQESVDSLPLATYISFPQSSGEPVNLTKETVTRYTSRADTTTEFYNVAQLWLAWTERNSTVRDYLVKGQQSGFGYVSVADRRGVIEFLQGENDGGDRVIRKGQEGAHEEQKAASSTVEALPDALESEAGPSKNAVPVKRKYEVDVKDREFCKKLRSEEIELRDRNSVMRTSGSGKVNNFESFVKGVMAEKIKALRRSLESSGSKAPQPSSQTADPNRAKKARSNTPIIMISSSPTALITMWNVQKFLEQGIFEPSEVARQNEALKGNTRSEDVVPITRKRTGANGDVTSKYWVVDGVEALQKFGPDPWERVICVLTTGQEWQFRPYKWQNPKVLFRNVTGVYFQWHNEPSNPAVKDWNVSEMRIDRSKRHTDRQVIADFWRILESSRKR